MHVKLEIYRKTLPIHTKKKYAGQSTRELLKSSQGTPGKKMYVKCHEREKLRIIRSQSRGGFFPYSNSLLCTSCMCV